MQSLKCDRRTEQHGMSKIPVIAGKRQRRRAPRTLRHPFREKLRSNTKRYETVRWLHMVAHCSTLYCKYGDPMYYLLWTACATLTTDIGYSPCLLRNDTGTVYCADVLYSSLPYTEFIGGALGRRTDEPGVTTDGNAESWVVHHINSKRTMKGLFPRSPYCSALRLLPIL